MPFNWVSSRTSARAAHLLQQPYDPPRAPYYSNQPGPQSGSLCQGCGMKPKYVENGRVHDYCGRQCRDRYQHARTIPANPLPTHHTYAQPLPQSGGLCQGCGTKPKYVENGRVHDYCGIKCRDRYHHARTIPANTYAQPLPQLCQGCGTRPKYVENGRVHDYCSKKCRDSFSGHSQGARLNIQTHYRQMSGPMSAQPKSTPRAPPLREYSKSTPNPRYNTQKTPPILFYDKNEPYYEFTNFSDHQVMYQGRNYDTSEHLFQSLKFLGISPLIAKTIRMAKTPREAFNLARAYKQDQRSDWLRVNIAMMDFVLLLKFQQHPELKKTLLETGDAELIENSPHDPFWGNGADKLGRNELGKALMRLRAKFQRGEA